MSTLYRKYRPKNFSSVAGQKHIIQTLSGSAKTGRIGNAYLLTGPRGTGKTTLARIFAKTVNCEKPTISKIAHIGHEPCEKCANCQLISREKAIDLMEIDAASYTGVDNIRKIKESVHLPPNQLKYKVYIIDEVHMLSIGAFNALLKTLEEPPAHVIFILATTELHKVPETIISRCQRFDISHLSLEDIKERLEFITQSEGFEIELEALDIIAFEANGGMRDAESLLGQILSVQKKKKILAEEIRLLLGVSSRKRILEFIEYLNQKNLSQNLQLIENIYQEGVNLVNFNKNLLQVLRTALLIRVNPNHKNRVEKEYGKNQLAQIEQISQNFSIAEIVTVIDQFQISLENFKTSPIPQLPLEIASIKTIEKLNSDKSADNSPETKKKLPKVTFKQSNKTELATDLPQTIQEAATAQSVAQPPSPIENSFNEEAENIIQKQQPAIKQNVLPKKFSVSQYIALRNRKKTNSEKSSSKNFPLEKTPSGKKIPLEKILYNWPKILDEIKSENLTLHSLLSNTAPYGSVGEMFFIRTDFPLYKETLNQSQNKLTVTEVIAKITGVQCELAFLDSASLREIKLDKHQKIEKDPLLQGMLIFGGLVEEATVVKTQNLTDVKLEKEDFSESESENLNLGT